MTASAPVAAPRELRVLQIVPVLFTGGLERVATALTIGLTRKVEHVAVCSYGGEPFEPILRSAGVDVIRIRRPKTSKPHDLLCASVSVARALRRERPHVVHAHNPTAGVVATLARRLARSDETPVVTTYHGVTPARVPRAARALAKASDVVVGVGPTSTKALVAAGLNGAYATTVYNAVETHDARRREQIRSEFAVTGELLVSVGRYAPEKNHALLLDALTRLTEARPDMRALLVGIGPLESSLRAKVRELGLDDAVVVTGRRADAPDITAAGDVFVLSSASEGLPIALLEAMAAGVPVVSTAVGGVADAVRDGETGILVPPNDAGAIARAVERVLDDADLRGRVVADARRFIEENCSPEAMVDHYVEVYLDAIARRQTRRTSQTR